MHQVALIGGCNTRAFKGHLTSAGLSVCAEVPTPPLRVPKRATALIVLRTHCSHKLYDRCQEISARRNIPMVAVDQSWAKAKDLLAQANLLPEAEAETEPETEPWTLYAFQAEILMIQEGLTAFEEALLERGLFDHLVDPLERLETLLDTLNTVLGGLVQAASSLSKAQRRGVIAELAPAFNALRETLYDIWTDQKVA